MMASGSFVPQQVPPTSVTSSFARTVPGVSLPLSPLSRGSPVNVVPKSTYRYLNVSAICLTQRENTRWAIDFSTQRLRKNLRSQPQCRIRGMRSRQINIRLQFGLALAQKRLRDLQPLRFQRSAAWRFVRAPIPVAGIGGISFLPMQIGVHPGASRTFILLCRFVCALPVALRIPPQASQGKVELPGRFIAHERIAKFLQSHEV